MFHRLAQRAAACAVLIAFATPAFAAGVTIKVLCSTASRTAMQALLPQFEQKTGDKVEITYGVANLMLKDIEAGEQFDVALLLNKPMTTLFADGKLVAGTRIAFARMPMAVGMHKGGHTYDISTVASFKQTLLDARSIVYSGPGASGVYFAGLLQKLGLADALKSKLISAPTGDAVGEALTSGKAELAILPPSEILPVKDAVVMGLFPEAVQNYDQSVGGISANARQGEAGKALLAFLAAPANAPVYVSKGLQPLNGG